MKRAWPTVRLSAITGRKRRRVTFRVGGFEFVWPARSAQKLGEALIKAAEEARRG